MTKLGCMVHVHVMCMELVRRGGKVGCRGGARLTMGVGRETPPAHGRMHGRLVVGHVGSRRQLAMAHEGRRGASM